MTAGWILRGVRQPLPGREICCRIWPDLHGRAPVGVSGWAAVDHAGGTDHGRPAGATSAKWSPVCSASASPRQSASASAACSTPIVTPAENPLWDPPGFLDDRAVSRVRAAGGLQAVTASHPHFYGAMADWSAAFGADILVPQADAS